MLILCRWLSMSGRVCCLLCKRPAIRRTWCDKPKLGQDHSAHSTCSWQEVRTVPCRRPRSRSRCRRARHRRRSMLNRKRGLCPGLWRTGGLRGSTRRFRRSTAANRCHLQAANELVAWQPATWSRTACHAASELSTGQAADKSQTFRTRHLTVHGASLRRVARQLMKDRAEHSMTGCVCTMGGCVSSIAHTRDACRARNRKLHAHIALAVEAAMGLAEVRRCRHRTVVAAAA